MRARFLFPILLFVFLVGPYLFAGTAHAQYQYFCATPDGLTYWDHNPCAYEGFKNHDFDKGPPYSFNRHTFQGSPLDENSSRDFDFGNQAR
jgi:hypothetical protein